MDATDLSCYELVELVSDYLDGRLPEEERVRFDAHVDGCEGCRVYVEQLRTTVALAGRLCDDELEPQARDALLATFRGWRRVSR